MKLSQILAIIGRHVWSFTDSTNMTTITDAHKRLQSAISKPPHNKMKVTATSMILTDTKTYESEPCLVIYVAKKEKEDTK